MNIGDTTASSRSISSSAFISYLRNPFGSFPFLYIYAGNRSLPSMKFLPVSLFQCNADQLCKLTEVMRSLPVFFTNIISQDTIELLKIKCGFICACNAFISVCVSCLSSLPVALFSSILRNNHMNSERRITSNEINRVRAHNGGRITIVIDVVLVIPSLP